MAHTEHAPRVAVIGAGLGGLSAAIRLAHAGYPVDLFEKQSGPGGKAFSEQIGAYRFDTGPSLFTLRPVFAQLFEETGRSIDDYVTLTPLEQICRYFWRDGARMESYADPDRFADQFHRTFGEDPAHLRSFLKYSEQIHRVTGNLFLERSLHEWNTIFTGEFWRSVMQLGKIDALRTMDRANRAFFKSAHMRQFFNRYATYNGSDPYQTPATLNIIPHVEYGIGAWSVAGGIYAIPRALERLARDVGVRLHYGVAVDEILTTGRPGLRGRIGSLFAGPQGRARVRGVRADGVDYPAEVVISNADVTPTYEQLLGDIRAPLYKRYQRLEPSSSGLVFYWGVRKRFPELGLHNIFFSDDYRAEFNDIFQQHRCPEDPTIYLNITAKDGAPDDAPADGENWFVLVNAPADTGQDWESEAKRVREAVLRRLSRELDTEIETVLEEEAQMTPPDIAAKTDSHRGSLYGIASNTRGAAFLRHPNRSRRYRGLYFAGGSAHPGGGMPLVVLGGRIVADLVRRHHSLHREAR